MIYFKVLLIEGLQIWSVFIDNLPRKPLNRTIYDNNQVHNAVNAQCSFHCVLFKFLHKNQLIFDPIIIYQFKILWIFKFFLFLALKIAWELNMWMFFRFWTLSIFLQIWIFETNDCFLLFSPFCFSLLILQNHSYSWGQCPRIAKILQVRGVVNNSGQFIIVLMVNSWVKDGQQKPGTLLPTNNDDSAVLAS